MGYQINENWDVSLFTLWDDNSAKDPGEVGADPSERLGTYKTKSWLTLGKISNHYENADGHLKVYYNTGDGDWLDEPTDTAGVTSDLYNEFTYYGFKAKENLYLWKGGQMTFGLDWEVTEGKIHDAVQYGGMGELGGSRVYHPFPHMPRSINFLETRKALYAIPSAGVRFYDNSDFENEWAPHAGVVFGYHDTQLHARYSRGILYPGLDVVVMSEAVIPGLGQELGGSQRGKGRSF